MENTKIKAALKEPKVTGIEMTNGYIVCPACATEYFDDEMKNIVTLSNFTCDLCFERDEEVEDDD